MVNNGEPDWSGLLPELLTEIAGCVSKQDFLGFRCVCSSWRAAAINIIPAVGGVPLLSIGDGNDEYRQFYSFAKRKICTRLTIPDIKDKGCISAGFGWLVTVAKSGNEASLWNLFSRALIPLPSLPDFEWNSERIRATLSANPNSCPNNFVLLLLSDRGKLGFWRPGNDNWTMIEAFPKTRFINICHHNGDKKFYVVGEDCTIRAWDPTGDPKTEIIVTVYGLYARKPWLIESSDGHLIVVQLISSFNVFRIDVVNRELKKLVTRDLGGDAVFVGYNTGIAVRPSPNDGIRANVIYECECAYGRTNYYVNEYCDQLGYGYFSTNHATCLPNPRDSRITGLPLWII